MSEDTMPDLEEQLADVGAEDAPPDAEDDSELDELQEKWEDIEARVTELEMEERRDQQLQAIEPGEEIFDKVFPADVATDSTFTELVPLSGTLTTFPDGRTGTVTALGRGQSVLVEVLDPGTTPPSFKFLKITGSNPTTAIASITAVNSTISAVEWRYTFALATGGTVSGYNAPEIGGAAAGSPGSLGIPIGTDGTVTGTTCIFKPLGLIPILTITWDASRSMWFCEFANYVGP